MNSYFSQDEGYTSFLQFDESNGAKNLKRKTIDLLSKGTQTSDSMIYIERCFQKLKESKHAAPMKANKHQKKPSITKSMLEVLFYWAGLMIFYQLVIFCLEK